MLPLLEISTLHGIKLTLEFAQEDIWLVLAVFFFFLVTWLFLAPLIAIFTTLNNILTLCCLCFPTLDGINELSLMEDEKINAVTHPSPLFRPLHPDS